MILATGTLLTFPTIENIKPDCFSQGHAILEKLATYHDSRNTDPKQQGNYTPDGRLMIGWMCS